MNKNIKRPKWLNEDNLEKWVISSDWRVAFQKEKLHFLKRLLFYTILSNGIGILISLIAVYVLWLIVPDSYFVLSNLMTIANITCVISASIIAILIAFSIFLLGRAASIEDQAYSNLRNEISKLELLRKEIGNYIKAELKDNIDDPTLKTKVKTLSDASSKFDNVLHDLIRMFSVISKGSFYDHYDHRVVFLPDCLLTKAGDWFVAYLKLFDSFDDRNFARRIQGNAISATSNLFRYNNDIKSAEEQRQKAIRAFLAMPSFLIIIVLSLLILFSPNIPNSEVYPFFIIWLDILLITLLIIHIYLFIRWVYQFIYREITIRAANREYDRKFSEEYSLISKEEMQRDSLKITEKYRLNIDKK